MVNSSLSEFGILPALGGGVDKDNMKYLKLTNVEEDLYNRVKLIAELKGWSLGRTAKFILENQLKKLMGKTKA